jgi:hypothetical protein
MRTEILPFISLFCMKSAWFHAEAFEWVQKKLFITEVIPFSVQWFMHVNGCVISRTIAWKERDARKICLQHLMPFFLSLLYRISSSCTWMSFILHSTKTFNKPFACLIVRKQDPLLKSERIPLFYAHFGP